MHHHTHAALLTTALGAASLSSAAAHADITGFPIPGWQVNQWDTAAQSPVNPPESIILTTTTRGQSRSMFYETTQDISQFQVEYTYQFTGTQQSIMGAAFVLHNRPAGASAVAVGSASGVNTNFGYSDLFGAFNGPSLAVSMQSGYLGAGSSSTGVYTGGSVGGGSTNTAPLNFFSGNPIDVAIGYNGFLLSMTALDTVTGESFASSAVQIDIPALMGGSLAYVGFTGSTNNNIDTTQTFSNFRFTSVPAPSAAALLAMGLVGASRRRR